ncbi:MAG: hypothetical protein KDD84_04605 [Caldilineaceae bacterium]|nr:hypothetical protein [Caldilineaceae bacterium]
MTEADPNIAASAPDDILLAEVAQRNPDALELLYDRHAPSVLGLVTRIVRDQAVAKRLLEETFWQVWQMAGQFCGGGAVATWIYRIARNQALDHLRKQQTLPRNVEFP